MNRVVYDIYSNLFPATQKDFARCRKIAHQAEMKVDYQPSLKAHFNKTLETIYHDGFEKQHKMLTENILDLSRNSETKNIANKVAKANTPQKLYEIFKNLENGSYDTPFIQKIHELFMRLFSPKTSSADTKIIAEKLKQAGVRDIRLGSNVKYAQHLLNAVEIAKKNNDKLPQRVFFSELLDSRRMSNGFVYYPDNTTMVLASPRLNAVYQNYIDRLKNELEKSPVYRGFSDRLKSITQEYLFCTKYSVDSPVRVPMHELGHINQPKNLPQLSFFDLDIDDKITATKLTGYLHSTDLLPELYAELYTKMRLKGKNALTSDERALLQKIINSGDIG